MSLENDLEKILKIKTTGRDDSNSDLTNFPYEATSYEILQELVSSEYITKEDTIIDYGCGKGRVEFYLSYYTKAKVIGIEYDQRLYNRAIDNLKLGRGSNRIEFINCCASEYKTLSSITGAYFFNPFSIHILKQVLTNIHTSYHINNREIKLFFYYPSDDYLNVLDNTDYLVHLEDIDCRSNFKKTDNREKISIYKFKNTP